MAPLPANLASALRRASFQMDFEIFRTAYQAAKSSFSARKAELEMQFEKLELAALSDSEAAYFEEYKDQLIDRNEREEQAFALVRSAFVISLFHLFEKHCNRGMKKATYAHDKAMAWLKGQNFSPDEANLYVLGLAANCLKHGAGRSANDLLEVAPSLFPGLKTPLHSSNTPDDRWLKISDQKFEEFLVAVQTSMNSKETV